MSVLTAADFLKLIDLEPFKKLNNEAGVSVSIPHNRAIHI